jgi:hypothetical protein
MIDELTHRLLVSQITQGDISYEEWLALHEAGRNGTLKAEVYVSPEENAQQYLATSKQVLFAPPIKDCPLTLLQKAMRLSGF